MYILMIIRAKKPTGGKMTENKDNYLMRYKISVFMHDPKETALSSAAYDEYESRRT